MPLSAEPVGPVSAHVASELLHAEVGYLLAAVGVPALHIKGPTVVRWLYGQDGRRWGDVDVLVSRSSVAVAVAQLRRHDFGEVFPGVDHTTSEDHSVVLSRPPGSAGAGEIDVHHRFPGIGAAPDVAFAELWSRRVPAELAHTAVWFPDMSSRALVVALNTARDPSSGQAGEDLRRLVAAEVDWDDVVALAGVLDARPALRAGLELAEDGRDIVARTALADVAVSPEWVLRATGGSRTAIRLAQLRAMPVHRRVRVVARWVVPHPSVMYMRDPAGRGGVLPLLAAYRRRLGQGARGLGAAARAARAARRRPPGAP